MFKNDLYEDFEHKTRDVILSENLALHHLNQIFNAQQKSCEDYGLPIPDMHIIGNYETNIVSLENSRFTIQEHIELSRSFVDLLNPDQKLIFDDVIDSIFNALYDGFKHFFVDGPGGTGKTFLFKALIHYLRSLGFIVVPVAWTGMAAS